MSKKHKSRKNGNAVLTKKGARVCCVISKGPKKPTLKWCGWASGLLSVILDLSGLI